MSGSLLALVNGGLLLVRPVLIDPARHEGRAQHRHAFRALLGIVAEDFLGGHLVVLGVRVVAEQDLVGQFRKDGLWGESLLQHGHCKRLADWPLGGNERLFLQERLLDVFVVDVLYRVQAPRREEPLVCDEGEARILVVVVVVPNVETGKQPLLLKAVLDDVRDQPATVCAFRPAASWSCCGLHLRQLLVKDVDLLALVVKGRPLVRPRRLEIPRCAEFAHLQDPRLLVLSALSDVRVVPLVTGTELARDRAMGIRVDAIANHPLGLDGLATCRLSLGGLSFRRVRKATRAVCPPLRMPELQCTVVWRDQAHPVRPRVLVSVDPRGDPARMPVTVQEQDLLCSMAELVIVEQKSQRFAWPHQLVSSPGVRISWISRGRGPFDN